MKTINIFATIIIIATLQGCVTTKYTYNGVVYNTPEEFHHAQQNTLDGFLDRVEKIKTPIVDTCTIYTLTFKTALNNTIVAEDKSSDAAMVMAKYMKNDLNFLAKAIEKRNLCKETKIIESDGMHKKPNGDLPTIYLYTPDVSAAGWYYVSNKTARTPLLTDSGIPDLFERFYSRIQLVEDLLISDKN